MYRKLKVFFRENSLTIVFLASFLFTWFGQALSGCYVFNQDQRRNHAQELSFASYLSTGHFWEATSENWESEFLQMGLFVILTTFLFQKGSSESLDPDNPSQQRQRDSKYPRRFFTKNPLLRSLYENSLGLTLLLVFALSMALHVAGGHAHENQERIARGEPTQNLRDFIGSAELWFQSFQNWQSEFLSVAVLGLFSIFLRQKGSPQSKPVDAPHSKTGSD